MPDTWVEEEPTSIQRWIEEEPRSCPATIGEGEAGPSEEIQCGQHWYRKNRNEREAVKGIQKLRKVDCGRRAIWWKWWRDKNVARKKKKNYI